MGRYSRFFDPTSKGEKERERERKIGREKKKSAAACGTLHPYDDDNPLIV